MKAILLPALILFALGAWPLLLGELPPFQDLPNHLATAHIVAHPELYPEYGFNGFFKSNALLTLWLHLFGELGQLGKLGHLGNLGNLGLFGAARAFTALVLAATALALPLFVLHFRGRRHLPVALLFAWPLVHSFSVSMGFLNFAFAFALSLILLTLLDQQRRRPTLARGLGIGALGGVIWYAHPFPLAVAGGIAALDVVARPTWRDRVRAACTLLLPLAPAGLLAVAAAQGHLMKAAHTTAAGPAYSYLNPAEIVAHLWTDVSGAFTPGGSMTIVPALLLPWFVWRGRRQQREQDHPSAAAATSRAAAAAAPSDQPLLSARALLILAAAYVALPVMLSNWWYLNCRLVPFLWAGLLLRLPRTLPRPVIVVLAACALAFSAATGIDYARLDRDRAEFTAGVDVVPRGARLLPLMFQRKKTSTFTASLTHAWGHYTVRDDTSAPLVFAVERSYPITYREFPPGALIPPALDRFAERHGTPAQTCRTLGRGAADAACTAAWRELWRGFWREAEPRFTHLLTWAMPPDARLLIPERYRRIFAGGDLEIYARAGAASDGSPPSPSPAGDR